MFILSACVDLWTGSGLLNIARHQTKFQKSQPFSYTSANFFKVFVASDQHREFMKRASRFMLSALSEFAIRLS
jgi:hypothetical protein